MFLSDGEHTIQALLKKQLHYLVSITDEIAPGAVLRVENYDLRTANRDVSRGSRHGTGQVVFLAVGKYRKVDFVEIYTSRGGEITSEKEHRGVEDGTPVLKRSRATSEKGDYLQGGRQKKPRTGSIIFRDSLKASEERDEALSINYTKHGDGNPTPTRSTVSRMSKPTDTLISGYDTLSITTTAPQDVQSRNLPSNTDVPEYNHPTKLPPLESTSETVMDTSPVTTTPKRPPSRQDHSKSASLQRPLNLLTLSDLLCPQTPFPKRNYMCDVIAVISWISPHVIKRACMPPKRDLRLIDPTIISTIDKRRSTTLLTSLPSSAPPSATANGTLGISMSVFVDAADFHPLVGTVALFRCLKTHEWDGISLNAYEKDCKGKEWFVTEPNSLATLGADASALKQWWLETQARWEEARMTPVFNQE
ncbi:uncharacterized protein GIQ15_06347 [Arthroderma uncinatum]|uniref:uncharacterized protein n=1 Tax=Arthroderma uncinatum TaxID=74035 RepID=UPI00144A6E5F|nr:uncharacterized protein GIQ15_06347 [Arthroderma uncinatum]KAF3481000.1 hypothetical protein GIQ15_06347 [Arthroderma uncinatum]